MLKAIVFTLTLLFCTLLNTEGIKAETIKYSLFGRYDREIDNNFQEVFSQGWNLFQWASKRNDPQPLLEYSKNVSEVRIRIYPDYKYKDAADYLIEEKVIRVFYNTVFAYYSPTRRAEVIAHELCHFYYNLPDEFGRGSNHASTYKYKCVMANFMLWGWHGEFCPDCRVKVDAYYRKKHE